MRFDYQNPFEDEELEARAWSHFDHAKEQGSKLTDADLIRHCREMAHQELSRMEALADEPVKVGEEE